MERRRRKSRHNMSNDYLANLTSGLVKSANRERKRIVDQLIGNCSLLPHSAQEPS